MKMRITLSLLVLLMLSPLGLVGCGDDDAPAAITATSVLPSATIDCGGSSCMD